MTSFTRKLVNCQGGSTSLVPYTFSVYGAYPPHEFRVPIGSLSPYREAGNLKCCIKHFDDDDGVHVDDFHVLKCDKKMPSAALTTGTFISKASPTNTPVPDSDFIKGCCSTNDFHGTNSASDMVKNYIQKTTASGDQPNCTNSYKEFADLQTEMTHEAEGPCVSELRNNENLVAMNTMNMESTMTSLDVNSTAGISESSHNYTIDFSIGMGSQTYSGLNYNFLQANSSSAITLQTNSSQMSLPSCCSSLKTSLSDIIDNSEEEHSSTCLSDLQNMTLTMKTDSPWNNCNEISISSDDFPKFIPIDSDNLCTVPKLLVNRACPNEWEDTLKYFYQNQSHNAQSSGQKKKHCDCGQRYNSTSTIYHFTPGEDSSFSNTWFQTPVASLAGISSQRFQEDHNRRYLKCTLQEHPHHKCHLYIASNKCTNAALFDAKTDLLCSAMSTFFYPAGDMRCLWIDNLTYFICELLKESAIKVLYSSDVTIPHITACLVVSKDAACLLRHKQLCFLQTVCDTLQICLYNLLVLLDPKAI